MKRVIYIAAVLLTTISFSSCQNVLEEQAYSYYDTPLLFSTINGARMAMNGVYGVMAHPDHYGQDEIAMGSSDDMYFVQGTASDNTRRDISHYQYSATNQWLANLWGYKYRGINRANSVLAQIKEMPQYSQNDPLLKGIEGEALFMRALLAYDIVRYWGDAPMKTTPTLSIDQAYQPKKSREEIYDIIEADLINAANILPWATATTNPERPTKGAAKALHMRALLNRSGYYLPSNAAEGSALQLPDAAKRREYFTKITKLYEDFVAKDFHDLAPHYRNYWKGFCQKKYSPDESLFEIAFFTPDGNNAGGGTWGSWIGPLTAEKSKYSRANAFMYVVGNWVGYYQEKDDRRLTNICNYEITASNDSVATKMIADQMFFPGKWRREWMTSPVKSLNNTDVNYIMLRFADVLLMAAEAYNELDDQATAKTLINRVRTRSHADKWLTNDDYTAFYVTGKPAYIPAMIPDGTEQGKVRRALFWERGFEFCYEGTRKYDLIRWGILYEAVSQTVWTAVKGGFSTGAPAKIKKGKHELFPIPDGEIRTNKFITKNNPGF